MSFETTSYKVVSICFTEIRFNVICDCLDNKLVIRFQTTPVPVPPEAGQRQPAWQQPCGVAEPSVQVGVQLGHALVQHAADLLPVKAAAGREDDELRQSLEQV